MKRMSRWGLLFQTLETKEQVFLKWLGKKSKDEFSDNSPQILVLFNATAV